MALHRTMFALCALALALVGCSTTPYKTDYDYDPDAAFGQYRTWTWISDSPLIRGENSPANPLLESRIMHHIEQSLTSKGFTKVDAPADADLVISFTVGARDRIKVTSYPPTFQAGYNRWGYGWGYGYHYTPQPRDVDVREYTEGQLAIDVFDVETKRPVYHGFASGNVSKRRSREEREQLLEDVVRDILATFPPA